MELKSGKIELDWVNEENKYYSFFNNSRGIVFAPTQKEASKLALLYDNAQKMLDILKSSHIYGGGAKDLEIIELLNKLK